MKSILFTALCFLSLLSFAKGGGGGHSSSGGSHPSSSHSEPSSHSSSHEESVSHESISYEHMYYSSTATKTYFLQPNGMYWTMLLNHHTNKMDTISASSKEGLDKKVNDLSSNDSNFPLLFWGILIGGTCLILFLVIKFIRN